ncbi:aspartate--ammonia ligase [Clostridium sp. CF011]|uniref:aspartate--ammonia ligase n=1 Tax=Clostridium sp. CF011 TaxID=2843318 RepID=UPI001C0D5A05|nr:aspartate--ammonia ligase [Clostridium sp. CF011]MBU3093514.1 aspartate--ammonia ligase [Clostridium sp. CF011]WAG68851.1 aspartate--ammonia ligase [Clostridium sp. CF011]
MITYKKGLAIPNGYNPLLGLKHTEIAIKQLKDYFENRLSKELALTRVSAPLFVKSSTGLNDNLSGTERAVSFDMKAMHDTPIEIVHSLAKWKRMALYRYNFESGEGLYTDMNAIRRDEDLDNLHSIYVDQWDWEKVILKKERTLDKLKEIVTSIYAVFKDTEDHIHKLYPEIDQFLPEKIFFITTQELEDMYPSLTPKEREDAICKEKLAVFIMQIGGDLKSGEKHDGRAPDYDDWSLNGDIVFWYPILEKAFELSSMGIRVDEIALKEQLALSGCEKRCTLEFHRMLLEGKLPYTMGGGIGQSRMCMYFLNKAHIGEVHSSIWPDEMITDCIEENIVLL